MATLQKTFKNAYVSHLKDEVKAGLSLLKYAQENFEYDKSCERYLANIYQPEGLLEKMLNAKTECETAIHLYEGYKNLSPLLASTENFWVYLTHTELFPYCQKRWPKVTTDEVSQEYVLDHWFFSQQGMMRNTLASLWWSVYFSVDETRENPYELTEVLFRNYSFRVIWFSVFLRMKNGLLGVLEFIKDNDSLFSDSFEMRGRFLAQYINRLGAVRNLSYLPRDYFYKECDRIRDKIALIENQADLKAILGQS